MRWRWSASEALVEYVARVLPAQAAAETGYVYQYSLTYLLTRSACRRRRRCCSAMFRTRRCCSRGVWLGRRCRASARAAGAASRISRPRAASSAAPTFTWSISRLRYPAASFLPHAFEGRPKQVAIGRARPARGSVDRRVDHEETLSRDGFRRRRHSCAAAGGARRLAGDVRLDRRGRSTCSSSGRPPRSPRRRRRRSPQAIWCKPPGAHYVAQLGTRRAALVPREAADLGRARRHLERLLRCPARAAARRRRQCAFLGTARLSSSRSHYLRWPLAAARDLTRLGNALPWRTMDEFADFYCAGSALDERASPYTYEPLRTCEHRVNVGDSFRGRLFAEQSARSRFLLRSPPTTFFRSWPSPVSRRPTARVVDACRDSRRNRALRRRARRARRSARSRRRRAGLSDGVCGAEHRADRAVRVARVRAVRILPSAASRRSRRNRGLAYRDRAHGRHTGDRRGTALRAARALGRGIHRRGARASFLRFGWRCGRRALLFPGASRARRGGAAISLPI